MSANADNILTPACRADEGITRKVKGRCVRGRHDDRAPRMVVIGHGEDDMTAMLGIPLHCGVSTVEFPESGMSELAP